MKYCPFKMANPGLTASYRPEMECFSDAEWTCEKDTCQLWNERFGMCSLAVDAYLKGQEDWSREKEIIRKGG